MNPNSLNLDPDPDPDPRLPYVNNKYFIYEKSLKSKNKAKI